MQKFLAFSRSTLDQIDQDKASSRGSNATVAVFVGKSDCSLRLAIETCRPWLPNDVLWSCNSVVVQNNCGRTRQRPSLQGDAGAQRDRVQRHNIPEERRITD